MLCFGMEDTFLFVSYIIIKSCYSEIMHGAKKMKMEGCKSMMRYSHLQLEIIKVVTNSQLYFLIALSLRED